MQVPRDGNRVALGEIAMTKKTDDLLSYDEFMGELLQDPKFVEEYLNEKLASGDAEQFLLAMGNIAKAKGGITKFAERTGLGRQTIYKAFSGARATRP